MRGLICALLLAGCSAPPAARQPEPPSIPAASSAAPSEAPTGQLVVTTLSGRTLVPGQRITPEDQLVFDLTGPEGAYLYLLEQGGGTLSVLHPPSGWITPGTGQQKRVVPQPTWMTEEDEALPGWTPQSVGTVEYILVGAPVPRGSSSDQRLQGGLEQILAPPPYVKGPAGSRATVLARLAIERDEPPEEHEEPQEEHEEPQEEPSGEPE